MERIGGGDRSRLVGQSEHGARVGFLDTVASLGEALPARLADFRGLDYFIGDDWYPEGGAAVALVLVDDVVVKVFAISRVLLLRVQRPEPIAQSESVQGRGRGAGWSARGLGWCIGVLILRQARQTWSPYRPRGRPINIQTVVVS